MAKGVSKIFDTIKRKAPTAPDGRYDAEAASSPAEAKETSVLHDLFHLKGKDAVTLAKALEGIASGEPLDDRDLLLERAVEMLQTLPANSGLSHSVSDAFIGTLFNEMPHPPQSTIEPRSRYRTADGSGNNPYNPDLGKAGSPYGRTVPPLKPKSPFQPDNALIFDTLFKRGKEFKEHEGGLSSLFTAFATIVIHNCFETDRAQPWINNTSSYVDLGPLYGNNQEQQDSVRTRVQGRIHPDCLASARIFMMPPAVIAVTLLFSRHHNYLAERLFEVNERGTYKAWEDLGEAERKAQDEDIFQLARNINIAFFAKVVLTDYVSAILGTVRADSEWHLELGKEIKDRAGARIERGTGNNVSAEFAVLYHWHSLLSAADVEWLDETANKAHPGKKMSELGPKEFMVMAHAHAETFKALPPKQWTFGGLSRKEDGYFEDAALASLIKNAIEQPAHAFGARTIPEAMKIVECMSMAQARDTFGVCTMNEFREYFNLKPFASFLEWNSDPEIAAVAERLYGHIDNLELYPGLRAEEVKPNMPGSGVQPGHTIGRAILDDAVALIRSDRFLTLDLNASTLTNWGMAQIAPAPGAYGGFLSHILYRALPRSWGRYSTYNHLPFYTPKSIASVLKRNGKKHLYDLERPIDVDKLHGVHSYEACKKIFSDRETFRNIYHSNLDILTDKGGFMIGFDDHPTHDRMSGFMHEAFFEPDFEKNVRRDYRKMTITHIENGTLEYGDGRKQLNVTRDVFNRVPVIWLADRYAIPLKTAEHSHGLLTVFQLQAALTALFIYSSFDVIPHASWILRQAALELGPLMRKVLAARVQTNYGIREKMHDLVAKGSAFEVSEAADHLYHKIHEKKIPLEEAVGNLLGTMIPIAGNITQQSTLILDLLLTPGYEYAKERCIELSKRDDAEAEKEFEMWVWEAMRVSGVVPGLPRVAAKDVDIDDGERGKIHVKAGERLVIATSHAHLDENFFPNPRKLDPTRDPKLYILLGHGIHFCFGARLVAPSIVSMLREILVLPKIRRAPGRSGELIRLPEQLGHKGDACTIQTYLDASCKESPVPSSFVIEYGP